MKGSLLFLHVLLAATLASAQQTSTAKSYFPPPGKWERRSPESSGFDTTKLNEAIYFALSNESKQLRSMELNHTRTFGKEPYGEAIGPFADRGNPTGVIIHKGYLIAEWGDPLRVDMTHSVTKSFLSTVVGLAVDKGLIKNVNEPVANYIFSFKRHEAVPGTIQGPHLVRPFESPHNQQVTWESMLRQTSDWEGTLWEKPDWADRPDKDTTQWLTRKRNKPGAVFEYNDVRVNALALATTLIWNRSLAAVLKDSIMDPVGASDSWIWHGYRNSWILLGGKPVQVVSGGGHWGGGMFITAYDMARFGLLTLHKGNWNGRQLISQNWLNQSLTPTTANPEYGYMNFFLNTGKKYLPAAPATAFIHVGNGTNFIYVDTEHELVMVVRWIDNNAVKEMVKKTLESLK